MDKHALETLAIHAGEEADPETGALRLPLHMATTFKLPGFGRKLFDALLMESDQPPHAYTRWSNPTIRALEERMVALERGGTRSGGLAAVATATGMAAVSALLLTLLGRDDHVVASEVCYAGSVELFGEYLPRLGIPSCYLALYEDSQNSRLVLAYDQHDASSPGRIELVSGGMRFPTRRLLPEGTLPARQHSFIIEPLSFQEHQLGLLCLKWAHRME